MSQNEAGHQKRDVVTLKPCPFCGEQKHLHFQGAPDGKDKDGETKTAHWIYCGECCASGPTGETVEAAAKEWQGRKA